MTTRATPGRKLTGFDCKEGTGTGDLSSDCKDSQGACDGDERWGQWIPAVCSGTHSAGREATTVNLCFSRRNGLSSQR